MGGQNPWVYLPHIFFIHEGSVSETLGDKKTPTVIVNDANNFLVLLFLYVCISCASLAQAHRAIVELQFASGKPGASDPGQSFYSALMRRRVRMLWDSRLISESREPPKPVGGCTVASRACARLALVCQAALKPLASFRARSLTLAHHPVRTEPPHQALDATDH